MSIEDALVAKSRALQLPTGLGQLGVDEALFDRIVQGALADHSHRTTPREASAADYVEMLRQSL